MRVNIRTNRPPRGHIFADLDLGDLFQKSANPKTVYMVVVDWNDPSRDRRRAVDLVYNRVIDVADEQQVQPMRGVLDVEEDTT